MDADRLRHLLRLTRVPFLGPRAIGRLLQMSQEHPRVLEEWVGWDRETLRTALRCHPKAVEALTAHRPRIEQATDLLLRAVRQTGVQVLALGDPAYPESLAALPDPPPLLTVFGNLDLLFRPRATIVCSREPSPLALDAARRVADLFADQRLVLVTGHNRDAYEVVAAAGKSREGDTLVVLDRGLFAAFRGDLNTEPVRLSRLYGWQFDTETQLALSPFRPDDAWIGENNRLRDALILALSDLVVATHVREGGVMERECRRLLAQGRTVYVCRDPSRVGGTGAADSLLAEGAEPLTLDAQGTYLNELFRDQFSTALPEHRELMLDT